MAGSIASAKATARMVRVPARKVRPVLDTIHGRSVVETFAILKFTPRGAASDAEEVLKSVVANTENNFDLDRASLVVDEAFANEEPALKWFRPRAKGSASPVNKRTSHITVVATKR